MIGSTAPRLLQLGFAAPTRETSESLNSAIGLRVRSHKTPPPIETRVPALTSSARRRARWYAVLAP